MNENALKIAKMAAREAAQVGDRVDKLMQRVGWLLATVAALAFICGIALGRF